MPVPDGRSIGGREISAVALGAASLTFDESVPREQAVATIHAAIEHGVRVIDTARAYTRAGHPAHNEELVAEALAGHAGGAEVMVATKGGHWRAEDGTFPIDGGPDRLDQDVQTSLEYLRRDAIDLYFLHWPDPELPIERSVEALEALRGTGRIRAIGLSNVDLDQLDRARKIAPIAAVQNHYSPFDTADRPVLEACGAAGIAYLSYSPLGGSRGSGRLPEQLPAVAEMAVQREVSVQRLLLAWLIRTAPTFVPIVGARRPQTITDSAHAGTLAAGLEDAEMRAISAAVAAAT